MITLCLFSKNKQLHLPMKKGTGIGIGVAVIVAAIFFGIASLSDEVLIESPSVDTSQNPSGEEKNIVVPSESVASPEQTEPEEETPVESVEQTEPEEETQGKVIEVKIKDGVGSKDK